MRTRHFIVRALFGALFALSLLVSQQMALVHAVSHISSGHQHSSGKQLPADQFCEHCLAAAQLSSGAASHVSSIATDAAPAYAPIAAVTSLFPGRSARFFQSRAPPRS